MSGGFASAGGLSKSAARDKRPSFPDPARWTGSRIVRSVIRVEESVAYPPSKAPVLDGVNAGVTLSSTKVIVGQRRR